MRRIVRKTVCVPPNKENYDNYSLFSFISRVRTGPLKPGMLFWHFPGLESPGKRPQQARIQGRWNGWIFTPLYLSPLLSFLFSYPLNIEIIFDFPDIITKIHPPFQNPGSALGLHRQVRFLGNLLTSHNFLYKITLIVNSLLIQQSPAMFHFLSGCSWLHVLYHRQLSNEGSFGLPCQEISPEEWRRLILNTSRRWLSNLFLYVFMAWFNEASESDRTGLRFKFR